MLPVEAAGKAVMSENIAAAARDFCQFLNGFISKPPKHENYSGRNL
jgi:hypothetical protein